MGNTQAGRDNNLSIHQRLLQSTTPPFSTRLEKSGRLRAEGGLNENLERHKNVTGPARQATAPEVKELRSESTALKGVVAELTLENRLLKKSMIGDGDDPE